MPPAQRHHSLDCIGLWTSAPSVTIDAGVGDLGASFLHFFFFFFFAVFRDGKKKKKSLEHVFISCRQPSEEGEEL